MTAWLNLGEILKVNASKYKNKLAVKDSKRQLTFSQYNSRANRLANGLMGMGLQKGDRIAVISCNCLEFMEIYAACAKSGIVVVPINWRISPKDMEFIIGNSDAKAVIAADEFVENMESIRNNLKNVPSENYIVIGEKTPKGYKNFEDVVSSGTDTEPDVKVEGKDTWILLYTSGTTGTPKGVLRSHDSYISFFLINEVEFGFTTNDYALILMPLCHVNSTFYSFVFTYIGAAVYVHLEKGFDPEKILKIIDEEGITFSSMIPTHYNLILNVSEEVKKNFDGSSIKQLLCSSAPVRRQTKLDIMKFFPNAALFEAYGSTEAGLVTILRPEEQMEKLGSIGKECVGTDRIKLLDENKNEVDVGEVGELFSRGPMMFDEYYKLPEKTKEAFFGEFFSAGDMAKMDEEGYYTLVDRKANMIITGGEHVYPSEVEEVISRYPGVFDVAVIGVPHEKWGEAVKAVVIPKDGETLSAQDIIDFCRDKMAGYKKPKSVDFIEPEEMPRTTTGKILHRELRKKYGGGGV
ncbi:MAG: AMP-binding protein [Methanomassiliicoccales archaeon]|nr:MAG: AMP-binding protein [Methanomassiliicoccales archaeon]